MGDASRELADFSGASASNPDLQAFLLVGEPF
jgi:hypothetical protein